jgi:hypothetical protein
MVFLLIVGAFLLVAVGLLGCGLWLRAQGERTRSWPQVEGRITELRVVREPRTTITAGARERAPLHFPHVRYTYRVGEQTHLGRRLRMGELATSSESHARARLERYQLGAPVPVFHDPRDPAASVLEHASSPLAWVLILAGVALLLLGVLLAGLMLTFR